MTIDEMETTVTFVRSDNVVRIYSSNPKHLNRLRADERATITKDYGDSAEFTIPADQFDPLKGFKRKSRPLTEEQRQALADRLAKVRNK